jgi:hypothetical protein
MKKSPGEDPVFGLKVLNFLVDFFAASLQVKNP